MPWDIPSFQEPPNERPLPTYSQHGSNNPAIPSFPLFSSLPTEIRFKIWKASLTPRIVRWIRSNDHHIFTAPSGSIPLLSVSREAREATFLYGAYALISAAYVPVYFSPTIDFLWFDPGWMPFSDLASVDREDPLDPFLPELSTMRNIMIHPNWSGKRMRPTVLFRKLPCLEKILVAADEKSIGFQSKVMLETVKEIKSYYAAIQARDSAIKMPYIAIGCLGWIGGERRRMRHGREDNRQLVKVFEMLWEMNAHMKFLREEEWRFTQDRFERPRIAHRLRWAREMNEVGGGEAVAGNNRDPMPFDG